jgi:hypothetical protein
MNLSGIKKGSKNCLKKFVAAPGIEQGKGLNLAA